MPVWEGQPVIYKLLTFEGSPVLFLTTNDTSYQEARTAHWYRRGHEFDIFESHIFSVGKLRGAKRLHRRQCSRSVSAVRGSSSHESTPRPHSRRVKRHSEAVMDHGYLGCP